MKVDLPFLFFLVYDICCVVMIIVADICVTCNLGRESAGSLSKHESHTLPMFCDCHCILLFNNWQQGVVKLQTRANIFLVRSSFVESFWSS